MSATLAEVKERIAAACRRAGRAPHEVRIVAVSKLQPVDKIRALLAAGQADFGENYVQEFLPKADTLGDPSIRWHFIGHLQTNKVKFLIGRCALIHSIDRWAVAESLSRRAVEAGVIEKILLQVNVADESSKDGWSVDELRKDWPRLKDLSGLSIQGLMTMPPLQNDAEINRPHFRRLRELAGELRSGDSRHPITELSMGTSGDYEGAVEEGATLVRLGTLLFGQRPAKES